MKNPFDSYLTGRDSSFANASPIRNKGYGGHFAMISASYRDKPADASRTGIVEATGTVAGVAV